jgi:hypothetical protein
MHAADRRLLKSARTVAALGELMAGWLSGTVSGHPGNTGADTEIEPIAQSLAVLNRAGYVTCASQPGSADPDMAYVEYRAGVEGFADKAMTATLREIARRHGLICIERDAPAWLLPWHDAGGTPVTRVNGQDCTWFGAVMSRRFLRSRYSPFAGCSRAALRELTARTQVTIIDPVYGRDSMWPVLAREVAEATGNTSHSV